MRVRAARVGRVQPARGHGAAGAEFQSYDRLEIVSTYGDARREYDAIRTGAALIDLPQRGILELTGKDRLSFLNNLITNQTWNKSSKLDMPANLLRSSLRRSLIEVERCLKT